MVEPLRTLVPKLQAAIAAAVGPAYANADTLVIVSDRADYQANAAMGLAKRVGRPPRDVAQAIVASLDAADVCESVEITGPGFINLVLRRDWLAARIAESAD